MYEKIEVKIEKKMLSRLQKISEILDISLNKIFNTSLLDGILPYWIPYQQILAEISNKETPIAEEDYQDAIETLSTKIDSDFENIQDFETRESEFESLYPFGHFEDLQERKSEFIKFLGLKSTVKEEEELKEAEQCPPQKEIIKTSESTDSVEEEEVVSPSLFSKCSSYVKDQVTSKITNFQDIIFHAKFLGVLALINFGIFYALFLTWPSLFDFIFMLENFPLWESLLSIVFILILIPIMVIITGFIVGKIYYYLIKKRRLLRAARYILFPLGVQLYLGKKITLYFISKRKKGEKYHNPEGI